MFSLTTNPIASVGIRLKGLAGAAEYFKTRISMRISKAQRFRHQLASHLDYDFMAFEKSKRNLKISIC